LFIGQYSCVLKKDNRLSLPIGFCEFLKDGAYLIQGFDRNLLILTTDAFNEVYRRVTSVSITDPLARLLLRLIIGTTSKLEVDNDRSIQLPHGLMHYANLDLDAVVVGQGDYFEIWSPELWAKQEFFLNDTEANAERFSTLTIATR
jgi:MraZ protein